MEIVKLTPALKDCIWGGEKLKNYGKHGDSNRIAESWELSFHKDGQCRIGNKPISEIVTESDLGANVKNFEFFPTLIKFIDAKDNLSVQVHPSDEYALSNEGQFGKTEMWYILDAEQGAGIYLGFKSAVTEEVFKKKIENGSIMNLLNFIKVKKGEHYFIESGTVHAIGAGVTLCEIQQNSNLTYRVYDYLRKDANGNCRELHIDKAIKVSSLDKYKPNSFSIREGAITRIGANKYFTVWTAQVSDSPISVNVGGNSYLCVTVVDGQGKIGDNECFKGDSFFVPANYGAVSLSGSMEVVLTKTLKYFASIAKKGNEISFTLTDDEGAVINNFYFYLCVPDDMRKIPVLFDHMLEECSMRRGDIIKLDARGGTENYLSL